MSDNSACPHPTKRFFECGQVYLRLTNQLSIEITRGMAILINDGWEAGQVAAVVVDDSSQKVTHLLLVRPHLVSDYRLLPVELIEQVSHEGVWLDLNSDAVDSLPQRSGKAQPPAGQIVNLSGI
jgi:hypothetical protein